MAGILFVQKANYCKYQHVNNKTTNKAIWNSSALKMLVPKDPLLRKIDRVIDFDFIRGKVKDLYFSDNSRSAVDPVVQFKMLFLGYLFSVRSERQLVRDIRVNVAYRWLIGCGLSDKIPDASTRMSLGFLRNSS
jgi:transposase